MTLVKNARQKTPSIRITRVMLIGGLISGLAACTTTEDLAALKNEPGYIAGYSDGCATASESEKSFSTKRVRDDNAFSQDRAYQVGWRAGLLQCNYRNDDETSDGGGILGEDQNF